MLVLVLCVFSVPECGVAGLELLLLLFAGVELFILLVTTVFVAFVFVFEEIDVVVVDALCIAALATSAAAAVTDDKDDCDLLPRLPS